MASVALASLTEMYTDSEGEETGPNKMDTPKEEKAPVSRKASDRVKTPVRTTVRTHLVSYMDDAVISDEEQTADRSLIQLTNSLLASSQSSPTKSSTLPEFHDVEMPPDPPGSCSFELQLKIDSLTEKLRNGKRDMNQIIQERKEFRNPSIYEKLIQFCNINEFGTNYHPSVYDPLKWNKSSYYDELAKLQKQDMDQREKERRSKVKRFQVEFVNGTAKKTTNGVPATTEEEGKKRKSKWDQVGVVQPTSIAKPATGIVTLTSSATGTKGTVISAFGSLPKKPKV